MSNIELRKSMLGGYTIGYNCPSCNARLKSSLNDAGKTDTCPDCKKQFIVPGTQEREQLRIQAEQQEAERKRREREEKESAARAKKLAAEKAAVLAALPPEPPPPPKQPVFRDFDSTAPQNASVSDLKAFTPTRTFNARQYPALRSMITVYRILGGLAMLVSLLCFLSLLITYADSKGQHIDDLVYYVFALGVGILGAIVLFAIAESIRLLLDIEENTRRSADNSESTRDAVEYLATNRSE